MTSQETYSIQCSRCGENNPEDRYFCRKCGLGLDLLLLPGESSPQDVDVGTLLKAGFVGGVIGACFSLLFLFSLQWIARAVPDVISSQKVPFLFFISTQLSIPFFFSLGAAAWIYVKGKSLKINGSWLKTLSGALTGILIALLFWGSSKILGVALMTLLPPILGARFGLGVLAPIWPLKKMLIGLVLVIAMSSTLLLLNHFVAEEDGISPLAVTCLNRGPSGSLWLANGRGEIFTMATSEVVSRTPFPVSIEVIADILPITKEHFFVRNKNRGIIEFSSQSPRYFLSERQVSALVIFKNHIVAGTDRGCLAKPLKSDTWKILENFDGLQSHGFYSPIKDLRVVDQKLVAAVLELGLFVLDDLTSAWRKINFPDLMPLHIVPLSPQKNEIFVATLGAVYQGNVQSGEWSQVTSGLPVHFIPQDLVLASSGDLFLATVTEVFKKERKGLSWYKINSFKNNSINGLSLFNDNSLYVATNDGLYCCEESNEWKKLPLPR